MSTNIEWTKNADGTRGETWNPITGCTPVSAGCAHCYAATMAKRLQAMGVRGYEGVVDGYGKWTGRVNLVEEALTKPLKRKKPTTYFVNSMSDLFHEAVPFEFIDRVFAVMALCPQHVFQVLTKRPKRMAGYLENLRTFDGAWRFRRDKQNLNSFARKFRVGEHLPNVWLGTSVENQGALHRIDDLRRCPAAVRFLSLEPLLENLGAINLDGIHWVICGGESGPNARPMHPDWARGLRDQCVAARVPFFFKQWGEWEGWKNEGRHGLCVGGTSCATGEYDRDVIVTRETPWLIHHFDGNYFARRVGKRAAGRSLDGRTWDEMPEQARKALEGDKP